MFVGKIISDDKPLSYTSIDSCQPKQTYVLKIKISLMNIYFFSHIKNQSLVNYRDLKIEKKITEKNILIR